MRLSSWTTPSLTLLVVSFLAKGSLVELGLAKFTLAPTAIVLLIAFLPIIFGFKFTLSSGVTSVPGVAETLSLGLVILLPLLILVTLLLHWFGSHLCIGSHKLVR